MGLTDYRALLIDCDEVLVDRDSGVWAALQPLLDSRGGQPSREQVLAEFNAVVAKLYPRFAELGFSGVLCFAHRQLAEAWGLHASWEEGMSFARSAGNWSLFEDAPGRCCTCASFIACWCAATATPRIVGVVRAIGDCTGRFHFPGRRPAMAHGSRRAAATGAACHATVGRCTRGAGPLFDRPPPGAAAFALCGGLLHQQHGGSGGAASAVFTALILLEDCLKNGSQEVRNGRARKAGPDRHQHSG